MMIKKRPANLAGIMGADSYQPAAQMGQMTVDPIERLGQKMSGKKPISERPLNFDLATIEAKRFTSSESVRHKSNVSSSRFAFFNVDGEEALPFIVKMPSLELKESRFS